MELFFKSKSELPIVRKPRAPAPPLGDAMEGAILPGTQRSALNHNHAPPKLGGHPAAEIRLRLGDLLHRIPSHFLKPGPHDQKRELLFRIGDLSSDISRGRATVPLSRIVRLCPDVFCDNPALSFAVDIHLPLQKLVEQIGAVSPPPAALPTLAPARPEPFELGGAPETKSPLETASVQPEPVSAVNNPPKLEQAALAGDQQSITAAQTSAVVLTLEPSPVGPDKAPTPAFVPEPAGEKPRVPEYVGPPAEPTPIVAASDHESSSASALLSEVTDAGSQAPPAATELPRMKIPPPPLIQRFPLASTLAPEIRETKPLPTMDNLAAEPAAEIRHGDPPIAVRPAFVPPPRLGSTTGAAIPSHIHLSPSSETHRALPLQVDHSKLADIIAGWVGIDACVIIGPGGIASAGVVPKGFAAVELETAARQLLGFIDQYPIEGGHFRNFDLRYAHTSLTVISNGEHLLCVFHRDYALDATLRDQIQESARGLS